MISALCATAVIMALDFIWLTLRQNVKPLFQNSCPDCHTSCGAFHCTSQFRRLSKPITKIDSIADPDIQKESHTPSHIRGILSVIKDLSVLVHPGSEDSKRNIIQDVSCASFSVELHAICHLMPQGSASTIVFSSDGLLCSR